MNDTVQLMDFSEQRAFACSCIDEGAELLFLLITETRVSVACIFA
jgi:hypothetical protein